VILGCVIDPSSKSLLYGIWENEENNKTIEHFDIHENSSMSSDLDHVSANGKRKYCDEQGCSEETDHLSLIKCFRHSGRFHRNQRCNIAGCDNWVLSNRRCEVHGGVAKHCTHGKLKGGCNECGVRWTLEK
jgi:hypothetical protein